ncbi:MAG: hypothetical protein AB7F74_00790 [Parvibaculaceae bacterium]
MQSQWDVLLTYLQQGRPPLWQLLAVVNGGLLAFWLYAKIVKDRPLRPATVHFMRVLFLCLNVAVIFRDDTLRILRPFLRYFI